MATDVRSSYFRLHTERHTYARDGAQEASCDVQPELYKSEKIRDLYRQVVVNRVLGKRRLLAVQKDKLVRLMAWEYVE